MNQPTPLLHPATAGERMASLHQVASLVASLAGTREDVATGLSDIDGAYDAVSTLARARFDDLAARATAVASAGIAALLACGDVSPAALATLAETIENEIGKLEKLLTA